MYRLPFNIVILRHWREVDRNTNSGKLVPRCIANADVVDMTEPSYRNIPHFIPNTPGTWLLFPASVDAQGQLAVPSRKGLPRPLPKHIVVVDGRWSEASKMAAALKHLPRFTPLYGPHASDRLLARPHAEAQATAEAVASVVRELDAGVADCLDRKFAEFVEQGKRQSGSTALKNGQKVFKIGDRVRILGGELAGERGTVMRLTGTYYNVLLDRYPQYSSDIFLPSALEKLNDLEKLAEVPLKNNPTTAWRHDRVPMGAGGYAKVSIAKGAVEIDIYTRDNKRVRGLRGPWSTEAIRGGGSELGYIVARCLELGAPQPSRTNKNPKEQFSVGDRVLVHNTICKDPSPGTIIPAPSSYYPAYYQVRLDEDPAPLSRVFHATDIEHMPALYELAITGKSKNNPEEQFSVGDRVRLSVGGAYSRRVFALGTVSTVIPGFPTCLNVIMDKNGKTITRPAWQVHKVEPLEELASALRAKKNPVVYSRKFEKGERLWVNTKNLPGIRKGEVVNLPGQFVDSDFNVLSEHYGVRIDGQRTLFKIHESALERFSPLDAIADLHNRPGRKAKKRHV